MKDIFIRVDQKGTFRGAEHISRFGDDFEDAKLELGISCYGCRYGKADAIKNLEKYWSHQACFRLDDFKGFQVTVFRGEKVGDGTDFEDCATCEEVIAELDAYEFFKSIYDKQDELDELLGDDKISDDEYDKLFDEFLETLIP